MSDKKEEKEYRQNIKEIINWLEKHYDDPGVFFIKQKYMMEIIKKILVDLEYIKVEINELKDDINSSKSHDNYD